MGLPGAGPRIGIGGGDTVKALTTNDRFGLPLWLTCPVTPPEARQDPPGTDRRTHTAWDVLTSHPASTSSPKGPAHHQGPPARPSHPRATSNASEPSEVCSLPPLCF